MKLFKIFSWIALVAICISCGNTKQTDSDTSGSDSIDLVSDQDAGSYLGTYEGMIPAARSSRIKTQLTVNEDNTFTLRNEYVGQGDSGRYEDTGNYEVINGKVLELTDKTGKKYFYRIQDGSVVLSDPEGNIAEGMGEMYTLNKI